MKKFCSFLALVFTIALLPLGAAHRIGLRQIWRLNWTRIHRQTSLPKPQPSSIDEAGVN